MSAKRSLGRLRRHPRRDDLAGLDDARVTAPAVGQDLYIKVVRLSDIKAMPDPRFKKSAAPALQLGAIGVI